MNTIDILGSLMKANMGASSGRLDTTFGNAGFGTPAGSSGGLPAGGSSGGIFDVLGKLAGSMLGGGTSAPAPGTGGGGRVVVHRTRKCAPVEVCGAICVAGGDGFNVTIRAIHISVPAAAGLQVFLVCAHGCIHRQRFTVCAHRWGRVRARSVTCCAGKGRGIHNTVDVKNLIVPGGIGWKSYL